MVKNFSSTRASSRKSHTLSGRWVCMPAESHQSIRDVQIAQGAVPAVRL